MKKQIIENFLIQLSILAFIYFVLGASCTKARDTLERIKTSVLRPKIVYTRLNPDSVILKSNPSFNLDLDNDGVNDFEFYSSNSSCGDGLIAPIVHTIYLSIQPASGGNMIMTHDIDTAGGLNLVAPLDSAVNIAADSLWIGSIQYLLDGASEGGYIRCMIVRGHWLNVSDKYLGLKFIKGNDSFYGWVRLSSTYSATATPYRHLTDGQFIIKDYAFNSTPNQPIFAGQIQ